MELAGPTWPVGCTGGVIRLMQQGQDWKVMKLYNCKSEPDQVAWTAERLKAGARVHDVALSLGGVDQPMRVIAGAKQVLRAEGWTVTKAFEKVSDAEGRLHDILSWRATNTGN